jgi:DNA-directed RNA polymerase subunit RPC12/RpoP
MIRTKDRFYWRDLLYLSRARDGLRCVQSGSDYDLYQCTACSSIIRFKMADPRQQNGQWFRIKPYEFFQLIKLYPSVMHDETKMKKHNSAPERKPNLYRCLQCASYWWKENDEWTRADDDMIEST